MNVYKNDVVAVRAGATLWRKTTSEEVDAWRNSDASKGMTSAGETKLPPRTAYRQAGGRTYKVLSGRCTPPSKGYSNPERNCAKLMDDEGVIWFARKADLAKVA